MPDFLSNRFHEKKKIIMAIASVFILVFFAVYAGSCFVTCGKLFSKLFGQNYQLMMVVGALFVLLYTFFGGFLAESASDFMQAIVMIIALVLVLTLGVFAAGGFHAVLENARQIPGFFDFFFTATPQVDANGVQQLTAAGQPFFGDAQPYPCSPFSQSLPGALATSVCLISSFVSWLSKRRKNWYFPAGSQLYGY